MNRGLYRERALLKFRRYYMHGVRNNYDPQKSSSEAMFRARNEILTELKEDKDFSNDAEREEVYSLCLEMMLIFKMALDDVPIDKVKLEEQRTRRIQEETNIEKQINGDAAEVLPTAVLKGIEALTTKEGKDATEH